MLNLLRASKRPRRLMSTPILRNKADIVGNSYCSGTKQWPLAPNSPKWRITRANVSNANANAFGECRRVRRVLGKRLGECRRVWRVRATRLGECWRVWRVRATRLGECRRVWRVRATRLGASVHDKIGRFKHKLHILYA